jgi:ankyrin repeat protein
MAAWVANAGLVARLLALGADPVAGADADFSTPLAWCVHGSNGDAVAVAELLLAAGAELEPRFAEAARGPLHAFLVAQRLK